LGYLEDGVLRRAARTRREGPEAKEGLRRAHGARGGVGCSEDERAREPVRNPKEVLEELESVRRYTRVEVLDIPTLRYLAMETEKPALVLWVDEHEQVYGRGLLDGFRAED
jgi:hypothetical protein